MPEIASAWLSILPRAKGFGKQLSSQTKSEIAKSGVGKSIANTVGQAGATAFKALGSVAVGSLAKIVTKGVKFNASMQGFGAAFRTLTREGEDYRDVLRGIEQIKLESALDKRVLAGAAQQLLSVGVSASDVHDRLRRLGLASMDNAESFQYLTRMYANAAAGAGIAQVQMDALAAKGFNPLMIVAEATGRTVESLQREFQGAEGNARLFKKALNLATDEGGKFSDAFDQMANTFPGAVARLENNWQMFVGRFTGGLSGEAGIMPHLSDFLVKGINPTLYKLGELSGKSEGLERLWQWIGGHLVNAGERLYQTVTPLAERFFNWLDRVDFSAVQSGLEQVEGLLLPIGGLLAGMLGKSLTQIPIVGKLFKGWTGPVGLVIGIFAKMWQQSEDLRGAVRSLVETAMRLFEDLAPVTERLSEFVGKLAAAAGDMLAEVLERLVIPAMEALVPLAVSLLETILDLITPILECSYAMEDLTAMLLGLLAAKKAFGVVTALAKAYKALTVATKAKGVAAGVAAVKIWAKNAALLANPIGAVIALVVGLVTALVYFFTQTEHGQRAWAEFTQFLRDTWETVTTAIAAAIEWLNDKIIAALEAMAAGMSWLNDRIVAVVDWIVDRFRWLNDRIADVVNRVIGFFRNLADRFSDAVRSINDGIVGIVEWFAGLPRRVLDAINSLLADFAAFFVRVWNDGNRAISDGIDAALQFFRDLPGNILSAIGNLGSLLVDKGRELIGGFIDGITGMASRVGGAISSILPGGGGRALPAPHHTPHALDGFSRTGTEPEIAAFSNPVADAITSTVTHAARALNLPNLWDGFTATDNDTGADFVTRNDLEAFMRELAALIVHGQTLISQGINRQQTRHDASAITPLHAGGW